MQKFLIGKQNYIYSEDVYEIVKLFFTFRTYAQLFLFPKRFTYIYLHKMEILRAISHCEYVSLSRLVAKQRYSQLKM